MTTTPEMTLLNYFEIHGHRESARILRAIVDKQRQAEVDALPLITRTYEFDPKDYATPHSDTDAHPENQGSDLFAANAGNLASSEWTNRAAVYDKTLEGITPEQARFAYDSALEAPTQAVPCDLRPPQGKKWLPGCVGFGLVEELTPNYLVSAAIYGPTKHRYITLSGETRQEPCCK